MLELDHIVLTAATLEDGVAAVEAALGVTLASGGKHVRMGTHNRLLGLGDLYLEVIATDPSAARPIAPRWFDMDSFSGRPRLTNWVTRCGNLEAALAASPAGTGAPMAMTRGDLTWDIAVPRDGKLPFGGAFPALIRWRGTLHPTGFLPKAGCRLRRLEIAHPEAEGLRVALAPLLTDPRVVILDGPEKAIRAVFDTPQGTRVLE